MWMKKNKNNKKCDNNNTRGMLHSVVNGHYDCNPFRYQLCVYLTTIITYHMNKFPADTALEVYNYISI